MSANQICEIPKKQRRTQTKPQPFSPGTSFFQHHHSLEPDSNGDELRYQRRKSKATTLKLSQTANLKNDQLQLTLHRKSLKNHTTLTIISANSQQHNVPEHKYRNSQRKQSQIITTIIAPTSTKTNLIYQQTDFNKKQTSSTPNHSHSENKKMNPCLLYFPIIKGLIQLTHKKPIMLTQCWARLLLQLLYVDLITYLVFVFIPVFFIANRLIDKIIRRIVNSRSTRMMYIILGIYILIIITAHITYLLFASLNYFSCIANSVDVIGIDLIIYCLFRLYRVSESQEEPEQQ